MQKLQWNGKLIISSGLCANTVITRNRLDDADEMRTAKSKYD